MYSLDIADCINETCPWSGKLVEADSLTEYDSHVIRFRNTGCRDKFESAIRHFREAKASRSARGRFARRSHDTEGGAAGRQQGDFSRPADRESDA